MIYAIEIPHQMPPKLYVFDDEEELIDEAVNSGFCFRPVYVEWELRERREGLDMDSPDEVAAFAKLEKELRENAEFPGGDTTLSLTTYEICWKDLAPFYRKPSEFNEFSEAWDFMFHDAHGVLRADTLEELEALLNREGNYHQKSKCIPLINRAIVIEKERMENK